MIKPISMIPTITVAIDKADPARECNCEHTDAITCIATREHMSRFNAMLTFARGDIDRYPGQCTCPCHRSVAYRSVTEVLSADGKKARAK